MPLQLNVLSPGIENHALPYYSYLFGHQGGLTEVLENCCGEDLLEIVSSHHYCFAVNTNFETDHLPNEEGLPQFSDVSFPDESSYSTVFDVDLVIQLLPNIDCSF